VPVVPVDEPVEDSGLVPDVPAAGDAVFDAGVCIDSQGSCAADADCEVPRAEPAVLLESAVLLAVVPLVVDAVLPLREPG